MLEKTARMLDRLGDTIEYSMPINLDEEGYIDKECPNEKCLSKFKVFGEDWKNLVSDEKVFCPFCRYEAPAESWYTTEQIEQAREQAKEYVASIINEAIIEDVKEFNRTQPQKGFIRFSLEVKGTKSFVNMPAVALEAMTQKIRCEKCATRYAVIGSAFYCPCCGNNSASQTFQNTIEKVKAKITNLDIIREKVSEISKDDAVRTCTSLIESSVPDLVVAFQRLCECVYPSLPNAKPLKRNVFQRLTEGSNLWKQATGEGYEDWLIDTELDEIRICFQQRHLLQHQDGIVDDDYLKKSGDSSYRIGQHLIIKETDIIKYADIIEKLGKRVIEITKGSLENE